MNAVKHSEGKITQINSLSMTLMPLKVRNRFRLNGDTSIGRQGRKNLCSLRGKKKATPRPPFVMASKTSCDNPQVENTQKKET